MPLHESTASTASRMTATPSLRRRVALLALLVSLATLAFAAHANATTTTLNVNASSGLDTNPGTAAAPLKTLTRALKLATTGTTVNLAAGNYGPGFSGDQYPATGLAVPAGVTITGAASSDRFGSPTTTLLGSGTGTALNLAGSATVRNLSFGGSGFVVGLFAQRGTQTLSNLVIGTPQQGTSQLIDGLQEAGGIALRGTAQATLLADASQANPIGTRIFANGAPGISIAGQSSLTMRGGQIFVNINAAAAIAFQQARLTLDGGATITGGDFPNCDENATGIALTDSTQATLNGAELKNIPGTGISMDATTKATINGATITREAEDGCGQRPSIRATGSATLTTNNATIASTGGQGVDGISTAGTVTLALTNTSIHGFTGHGIRLSQAEHLTIAGGSVNSNAIGVEVDNLASGNGHEGKAHIKVTDASAVGNGIAFELEAPIFKLRDSKVIFNQTGIEAIGVVGGFPVGDDCFAPCVNLGVAGDPGNNNFAGNSNTAVKEEVSGLGAPCWRTGTSGTTTRKAPTATGSTRRRSSCEVTGRTRATKARTSCCPSAIFSGIELAADTVGRSRLTPGVLRARAGAVAHLTMTWTHPRSWTQLKTVQLRIYRGATVLGTVTVTPRSARLRSSGAIIVIPSESRVTHDGKTVSARLAVRLARSLIGKRLRLAVQASDRHGHSQLEAAGAIHATN